MSIPVALCIMQILYNATSGPGSVLFSHPRRVINDWLIELYNTSPLFPAVWPYIPYPSTSPLLSTDNLWLAVWAAIIAYGYFMRDSGDHLRKRIAAVRRRAQDKRWERSLTGDLPRPDVLVVQIDLTTRDQWYKRPVGIVLLAVIVLLIGRLFNLAG